MSNLFIFVEGFNDRQFIENVYDNILKEKYSSYKIIEYSQKKSRKIDAHISSIKQMCNTEYIFLADYDGCVNKKEKILSDYKQLDENNIFISKYEIESWIISGIDQNSLKKLKIRKKFTDTETVTKEQFEQLIPQRFTTRTDFCLYIYEIYNLSHATSCNESLRIFHRRFQ